MIWITVRPEGLTTLYSIIFLIGMTLIGTSTSMYAMVTRSYPSKVRSTGVGAAAGIGRVGAILSPALAGAVIALGLNMYTLVAMLVVPPIIIATILMRKTSWNED